MPASPIERAQDRASEGVIPRPLSEWHEGHGDVLWWRFPIEEPPYVGSPLDLGHQFEVAIRRHGEGEEVGSYFVGGWPGYHTHWTPIPVPQEPTPPHPAGDQGATADHDLTTESRG